MAAPMGGGLGPSSLYDHLSMQFRAPEFIGFYGALTERTVLDYFAQSPFYDKTCTNQMLRMQNIASFATQVGRWSAKEEEEQLKKFTGTEYIVALATPPSLFVIQRRERKSPTQADVTAAYYIINDAVMQAPDLYTMLGNRMTTALNAISNSLTIAREAQPPLDLRSSLSGGRAWKVFQEPDQEEASPAKGSGAQGNGLAAGADGANAPAAAAVATDVDANANAASAADADEAMEDAPSAAGPDASLKRGAPSRSSVDKRVRLANG